MSLHPPLDPGHLDFFLSQRIELLGGQMLVLCFAIAILFLVSIHLDFFHYHTSYRWMLIHVHQ